MAPGQIAVNHSTIINLECRGMRDPKSSFGPPAPFETLIMARASEGKDLEFACLPPDLPDYELPVIANTPGMPTAIT